MEVSNKLAQGFERVVGIKGIPIMIKYFDTVYDDVYDEAIDLVQNGSDLWISGAVFPLKTTEGSDDSVLLEQGKLQDKDKKLYVNGSIPLTGTEQTIKIQLGSPTGEIYSTIPLGVKLQSIGNDDIYKRQYIRLLNTGSF